MMKNLTLALGLMIIASPAFATTARLTALGEDPAGSYYIQDVRNIFLNPAQIVHYKKKLVLEFNPTVAQMGPLSPQGLFTNTFGDFTYGLSLNNNSARASNVAGFATPILAGTSGNGTGTTAAQTGYGYSAGLLPPDRTIELFFAGGDSSLGWGASLFYSGNGDKNVVTTNAAVNPNQGTIERTSHVFGARAGVEAGSLQAFATVGITSDTKLTSAAQSADVKGKISIDAAVTYAMDNTTAFAKFTTYGADVTTAGFPALPFTSPFEYRYNSYGIGLGHKYEASKTITLYGRIEADYIKLDNINSVPTTPAILQGGNTKTWTIPVAIAAEAQALSWLTLRGSVTQSLWSQSDSGAARATGGKTVLGSGAGLTLGEVQIDGTLSAAVNPGSNGLGIGNPFGNVAMTYNF